jgi:hypothetical protein
MYEYINLEGNVTKREECYACRLVFTYMDRRDGTRQGIN